MFHSHPPRNYSQSLLCLNIVLGVLIMFIVRLKGSGVAGINAVCSYEGFSNSVRRVVYGDTDHPFASPVSSQGNVGQIGIPAHYQIPFTVAMGFGLDRWLFWIFCWGPFVSRESTQRLHTYFLAQFSRTGGFGPACAVGQFQPAVNARTIPST